MNVAAKHPEWFDLAITMSGTFDLTRSVKLGADVGVAAGPVGAGASAATANISADIIIYSLSKGLYGGISLEGAVVGVRNQWNEVYYKKPGVTPTDILIRKEVSNPESAKLIAAVSKATGGTKQTVAEPKKEAVPESGGRHYEVRSGDTLHGIAKKKGTTVDELVQLNDLKDKKSIYPGQKLLLPGK